MRRVFRPLVADDVPVGAQLARPSPSPESADLLARFTRRGRDYFDSDGTRVDVEFIHFDDASADDVLAIARFEAALPAPFVRILAYGPQGETLFALVSEADVETAFGLCRRSQPAIGIAARMAQVCLLGADVLDDTLVAAGASFPAAPSIVHAAGISPRGVVLREPLSRPSTGGVRPKVSHLLSPEQVRGLPRTSATHQFSVAVALLGWVSGRRPFIAESDFAQIDAVREVALDPPLRSRSFDRELADVLERMLAREPGDRFSTVAEAHAALGRFAADDEHVEAWIAANRVYS